MMRLLALVMLFFALPSHALDVSALGDLPVQHEGRVKPLDSVARVLWQGFGGDDNATEHLVQALFAQSEALEMKHFYVQSDALLSMLNLPINDDKRYSYVEVISKLREHQDSYRSLAAKDRNKFTATQRELWSLFEAVDVMTKIVASMSLFLPVDIEVSEPLREEMQWPEDVVTSYFVLSAAHSQLRQYVQKTVHKKGDKVDEYTPLETEAAMLSMRLDALAATGRNGNLLRFIPSQISEEWVSPWAVVSDGVGTPQMAPIMQHWQALAVAYRDDNQVSWDQNIAALQADMAAYVDTNLLQAEQFYYQLDLVNMALFSYLAVLLLGAFNKSRFALMFMGFALAQHVLMLALRIFILGRPPVSSLYESVLFVSLVAALCGAVITAKSRARDGVMIGAVVGALLLAISGVYAGEQDTMSMPIAVLNTNFWLATHVIIITAGYGATLVAATLAHVALWSRAGVAVKYLQSMALLALLLTTIGTILGGVWADQSWGRFWGWDPKENGALLIVLWLAWLLHARMTKYVGGKGFAALLAISNIIVALSWFGVNLLNVGLHSYGFTSEAALGLAVFCIGELLLIAWLYIRQRRAV